MYNGHSECTECLIPCIVLRGVVDQTLAGREVSVVCVAAGDQANTNVIDGFWVVPADVIRGHCCADLDVLRAVGEHWRLNICNYHGSVVEMF